MTTLESGGSTSDGGAGSASSTTSNNHGRTNSTTSESSPNRGCSSAAPSGGDSPGGDNAPVGADSPAAPSPETALRRVKLYMLNEERQWDDRGTGHVSHACVDRLGGVCLIVRSEADRSVLLESPILADTSYQKQQTTLIVWSEGVSQDLALSFQERAGCDEIWEKICQVQGKDPSVDVTQEIMDEGNDEFDDSLNPTGPNGNSANNSSADTSASAMPDLPTCDLAHLAEIEAIFREPSNSTTPIQREKLALAIESHGYVESLLGLFTMCEDIEDTESLHRLYSIVRALFMLNKNSLFQSMFEEGNLMRVVGALEYDPARAAAGRPRECHREFLLSRAVFREVVPVHDEVLLAKIHQTYRVQYIQEVMMPAPSVFEENLLSTLNSFLYYNKVDIVKMFQQNTTLLGQAFTKLNTASTSACDRRDLVLFLREFCTFSHTLQATDRDAFFKSLQTHGVLDTLELVWVYASEDAHGVTAGSRSDRRPLPSSSTSPPGKGGDGPPSSPSNSDDPATASAVTRSAAADVFAFIVETNPSMVREFSLKEVERRAQRRGRVVGGDGESSGRTGGDTDDDDDEEDVDLLVNAAVEQMKTDPDPELGMAVQLAATLKMLVDPENMMSVAMRTEKAEFLLFFYRHCMPSIAAPLLACTLGDQPSSDSSRTAHLLSLILELLSFCAEHHAFHFRNYLVQRDLLRRALVLLRSAHGFLALATLRFMRRLVGLKDDTYNRYIIRGNLFEYVTAAFKANGARYNLFNSAVIEMFDFIRTEDIKALMAHVVECHWDAFADVDYVQTFKQLRDKHIQRQEPYDTPTSNDTSTGGGAPSTTSGVTTATALAKSALDDEVWFDREDEEEYGEGSNGGSSGGAGGVSVLDGVGRAGRMVSSEEEESFTQMSRMMASKRARQEDDDDDDSPTRLLKRSDSMSFNIQLKSFTPSSAAAAAINSPVNNTAHNRGNLIKLSPSDTGGASALNSINKMVLDSRNKMADITKEPVAGATTITSLSSVPTTLVGLVDYSDDDSDEEDDEEEEDQVVTSEDTSSGPSPAKRLCLSMPVPAVVNAVDSPVRAEGDGPAAALPSS